MVDGIEVHVWAPLRCINETKHRNMVGLPVMRSYACRVRHRSWSVAAEHAKQLSTKQDEPVSVIDNTGRVLDRYWKGTEEKEWPKARWKTQPKGGTPSRN